MARQSEVWRSLPSRVFVSHSYADEAAKAALLGLLPDGVEPIVFPRVDPNPQDAVSNGILPAILSCGALIYLEGGRSEKSIWVNFERDYAKRAGLDVLRFDPDAQRLDTAPIQPADLKVQLVLGEGDEIKAKQLLAWMKAERSFELDEAPTRLRMKEIPGFVAQLIQDERIVVWLMGEHVSGLAQMAFELTPELLSYEFRSGWVSEDDLSEFAAWLSDHSMYVRLTPDGGPRDVSHLEGEARQEVLAMDEFVVERHFYTGWAVDLLPDGSDEINWNRADDLIIRLTLMAQRSRPLIASEL